MKQPVQLWFAPIYVGKCDFRGSGEIYAPDCGCFLCQSLSKEPNKKNEKKTLNTCKVGPRKEIQNRKTSVRFAGNSSAPTCRPKCHSYQTISVGFSCGKWARILTPMLTNAKRRSTWYPYVLQSSGAKSGLGLRWNSQLQPSSIRVTVLHVNASFHDNWEAFLNRSVNRLSISKWGNTTLLQVHLAIARLMGANTKLWMNMEAQKIILDAKIQQQVITCAYNGLLFCSNFSLLACSWELTLKSCSILGQECMVHHFVEKLWQLPFGSERTFQKSNKRNCDSDQIFCRLSWSETEKSSFQTHLWNMDEQKFLVRNVFFSSGWEKNQSNFCVRQLAKISALLWPLCWHYFHSILLSTASLVWSLIM